MQLETSHSLIEIRRRPTPATLRPRPAHGRPRAAGASKVYLVDGEPLESIMTRYVAGDARAFNQLYRSIAPRVGGYLRALSRDPVRAEELCQTTFFRVHRGRFGWLPQYPVVPWIMAIARNAFIDDSLQRRRARVGLTATGELPEIADGHPLADAPATSGPSPEIAEMLALAVDALPRRQREALDLTTLGGLTHEEAAAALGTTTTAIKLSVHRAYEALRGTLRTRRSCA